MTRGADVVASHELRMGPIVVPAGTRGIVERLVAEAVGIVRFANGVVSAVGESDVVPAQAGVQG